MPTGIYDRTKSKPNAGLFKKGQHPSLKTEFKKGIHRSPNTEFKVGIGYKGLRTFYSSEDWLNKQKQSHKGQHSSPQTEFKKREHPSPSTEFKKIGLGISSDIALIRNSVEYRDWRNEVFKRDNFICQKCGQKGFKLNAHHIMAFSKYPEKRFDVSNGITLCEECHIKFHDKYSWFDSNIEQVEEFISGTV